MRQLNRPFQHIARRTPAISSMVLTLLAALTLLMPVNYRAGTDDVHAHTIFQIWIDTALGRSHHHHEAASEQRQATSIAHDHAQMGHKTTNAIAHAMGLPHVHAPDDGAIILGDAPVTQRPDNAEPVTTHLPIQHSNILGTLGVLIALLSTGMVQRSCWPGGRRLTGVLRLIDPPPPRVAPC